MIWLFSSCKGRILNLVVAQLAWKWLVVKVQGLIKNTFYEDLYTRFTSFRLLKDFWIWWLCQLRKERVRYIFRKPLNVFFCLSVKVEEWSCHQSCPKWGKSPQSWRIRTASLGRVRSARPSYALPRQGPPIARRPHMAGAAAGVVSHRSRGYRTFCECEGYDWIVPRRRRPRHCQIALGNIQILRNQEGWVGGVGKMITLRTGINVQSGINGLVGNFLKNTKGMVWNNHTGGNIFL